MMGNGNYNGAQECALRISKFREAHAAYEAASDTEKQNYFARRHAALMLLLGAPPQSQDEICEVMRIALDELSKHVMLDGPVPSAVAAALSNCLRAMEHSEDRVSIEQAVTDSVPPEAFTNLDSEIAKLGELTGLLAYLANNSSGKDEQAVFSALKNGAEAIGAALSTAVDKLMLSAPTRHRHAGARR